MALGLTRGEILFIAFIFALIYSAGFLPRLALWLTKKIDREEKS